MECASGMKTTFKIIRGLCLWILFLLLLQTSYAKQKEVFTGSYIDTSNHRVMAAVHFLQEYYNRFIQGDTIPYRKFFTAPQCARFKNPDPIVYAITDGVSTYRMFSRATIFFAKEYPDYVHLKTIFLWETNANEWNPAAITNHYVYKNENGCYFLTEMEQNKSDYTSVKNGNIEYVFPKTVAYNKQRSDTLLANLRRFEKEWGFTPIENIRYVYAANKEQLAKMKGLDYLYLMDENTPSGYADKESNTVYCQGKGENYLHELLHLYLNPWYEKSPVNHGLVYYLGGGVSGNYQQMMLRMNGYLIKYPATDLSGYDTLLSKDRMLHINHAINAMLCKLAYEKEGVKGVKRLLDYKTLNELFMKEYKLPRTQWDAFLRKEIAIEAMARKN